MPYNDVNNSWESVRWVFRSYLPSWWKTLNYWVGYISSRAR